MNLSLSDVMFVGFIILIVAGLLAGLGELRDWLGEGREIDRVRRLADQDQRHPWTVHPQLEQVPEDCDWCTPGVPVSVAMPDDCTCTRDCRIGYCQRRPELQGLS